MKKYGIYLAYAPTVDLRAEGLGRHLSEFLLGARQRGDIRFVIACPSWLRKNLIELFDASGLGANDFEIISPKTKPLLLSAHQAFVALQMRPRKPKGSGWLRRIESSVARRFVRWLTRTRSVPVMLLLGVALLPLMLLATLLHLLRKIVLILRRRLRKGLSRLADDLLAKARAPQAGSSPTRVPPIVRLFQAMEEAEALLLHELIAVRTDIAAWYSPTAFWPQFNRIAAPRLMCVPDVVLADFPVGFAPVGGARFLSQFRQVEQAIAGGQHFVTYSEHVKWQTLAGRYQVHPDKVSVVRHGANRLDGLIRIESIPGLHDTQVATDALCRELFRRGLRKALYHLDARIFGSGELRFLFYASQFRPNKNVMSLLRAYEYLLRRRYIGHKLILTGNPGGLPEVREFVTRHRLENDVLFLHGLSAQELAACYRLADLAVNPSLSEGGCPFTFTEALSVGTPAVMARIAVTEEVIDDPALQEAMLFDPFDWRAIAAKIEWALEHKNELLAMQRPFYDRLAARSWREAVDEYVAILDRISTPEHAAPWMQAC